MLQVNATLCVLVTMCALVRPSCGSSWLARYPLKSASTTPAVMTKTTALATAIEQKPGKHNQWQLSHANRGQKRWHATSGDGGFKGRRGGTFRSAPRLGQFSQGKQRLLESGASVHDDGASYRMNKSFAGVNFKVPSEDTQWEWIDHDHPQYPRDLPTAELRNVVVLLRSLGPGSRKTPRRFARNILRSWCPCPSCFKGGRRTFNILDVPDNPTIKEIGNVGKGKLRVVWKDDFHHQGQDHVSEYGAEELEPQEKSESSRIARFFSPIILRQSQLPWDAKGLGEPHRIHYDEFKLPTDAAGDRGQRISNPYTRAIEELHLSGLVVIHGVPQDETALSEVARTGFSSSLVPIQIDENILYDDNPSIETPFNTCKDLRPRTEFAYLTQSPAIAMYHCLQNDLERGGELVLVDGLRLLWDIHETPEDHEHFHTLCRYTPRYSNMNLHDRNFNKYKYDTSHYVIGETYSSRHWLTWDEWYLNQLQTDCLPPRCKPEEAGKYEFQKWIPAAKVFRARTELPADQVIYRPQAGEIVVLDNHRILCGRRKFDPTEGCRYLKQGFVSRDDWLSCLRLPGFRESYGLWEGVEPVVHVRRLMEKRKREAEEERDAAQKAKGMNGSKVSSDGNKTREAKPERESKKDREDKSQRPLHFE